MTEQHPITPSDGTFYEFTVSNDSFSQISGRAPTLSQAIKEGKDCFAPYGIPISQDGRYTLEIRRAEVVHKFFSDQQVNRALEQLNDD